MILATWIISISSILTFIVTLFFYTANHNRKKKMQYIDFLLKERKWLFDLRESEIRKANNESEIKETYKFYDQLLVGNERKTNAIIWKTHKKQILKTKNISELSIKKFEEDRRIARELMKENNLSR